MARSRVRRGWPDTRHVATITPRVWRQGVERIEGTTHRGPPESTKFTREFRGEAAGSPQSFDLRFRYDRFKWIARPTRRRSAQPI